MRPPAVDTLPHPSAAARVASANTGPYTVLVASGGVPETAVPRTPCVTLHLLPDGLGADTGIRRVPSGLVVPETLLTDDLLVRALAALHGDVVLYAAVEAGTGGSCRLVFGRHTLRCLQRPVVLRGTSVLEGRRRHTLVGVTHDGTDLSDLPLAERIARLEDAADPRSPCALAHSASAARLDPELIAAARATHRALPAIAGSLPHSGDAGAADELGISPALAGLRDLQHRADRLYGRLEPERALSWFLEELGELAQALRRNEPSVRVEEELGQVAAWCLCMANIARVDLGGSLSRALHEERRRQLRKYGALRPYVSQEEAS